MNKYIVTYSAGNSFGNVRVEAHNKKEAIELARMSVQYGMKKKGKFTVYKVKEEKL